MKIYHKGHGTDVLRLFSIITIFSSVIGGVILSFETTYIQRYGTTVESVDFTPVGLGWMLTGLCIATVLWASAGAIDLLKLIAERLDTPPTQQNQPPSQSSDQA